MPTPTEIARWKAKDDEMRPKIVEAMVNVHTPLTVQGAGLLVSGRPDGLIVHMADRNGTIHHIELNAHLAQLLAADIVDAGRMVGWLETGKDISEDPA